MAILYAKPGTEIRMTSRSRTGVTYRSIFGDPKKRLRFWDRDGPTAETHRVKGIVTRFCVPPMLGVICCKRSRIAWLTLMMLGGPSPNAWIDGGPLWPAL